MTQAQLDAQELILNHPRASWIYMPEDQHVYLVQTPDMREQEQWSGVTSLIKKFSPFDSKKIAMAIARRDNRSVQSVYDEWASKRNWGSVMHNHLEDWGLTGKSQFEDPEVERTFWSILQWLRSMHLVPIAFEYFLFDEDIKTATMCDLVCLDRDNRIVFCDYKTSKKIDYKAREYQGKKEMMSFPLQHLAKVNFNEYSLQLGLEAYWWNKHYVQHCGVEMSPHRYILHIPRDGEFKAHLARNVEPEIEAIYEFLA